MSIANAAECLRTRRPALVNAIRAKRALMVAVAVAATTASLVPLFHHW